MIHKFKTTEKSVRLIEGENTIVVLVDRTDKKPQIKKMAEETFGIKVESINTHIQANHKFAYIKLNKKNPAIDVATKYGLI
jgi:large subunit ribosomal protein L23